MRLVYANAAEFKKSIDAISALIDEAEFLVDEAGISLKATDPSQIAMVDFKLARNAFKQYDVKGKQKLGVDLSYLSQIMSRAKSSDELVLEFSADKSRLNIAFKGASNRAFEMPLIDIGANELPNPKIDFDAEIKLKAAVLQDALKDAALVSTHVSIGIENDAFFVRASSSKGTLNSETSKSNGSMLELKAKKGAKSMFPLDYLSDMLKVASADNEIELKLRSNAPARISYKIGEASITYFLAPRIESES